MLRLLAFKRAYKASAILLAVILGLSVPGYLVNFGFVEGAVYVGVGALVVVATLLPLRRKGASWKTGDGRP